MAKTKKAVAFLLAAVMLLAVPSAAFSVAGFTTGVRDKTYTYIDSTLTIPIPDAFQFRESIYIAELIGESDRRYGFTSLATPAPRSTPVPNQATTLGRPSSLFIAPAGTDARPQVWANHMFITFESVDHNGIIVLDDNHQILRCARTNRAAWNEFVMPRELFYSTFAHMYPDELRTEADIAARRDRFIQRGTCYQDTPAFVFAERLLAGEVCEGCALRHQFNYLAWVVETEPEVLPDEIYGFIAVVAYFEGIGASVVMQTEAVEVQVEREPEEQEVDMLDLLAGVEAEPDEYEDEETEPEFDIEIVYEETGVLHIYIGEMLIEMFLDYNHVLIDGEQVNLEFGITVWDERWFVSPSDLELIYQEEEIEYDYAFIDAINAIVQARGFADRYEWRRYAVAADIQCTQDYYFTTSLFRPQGLFVCRDGNLYIADTQNNRVLVVSPDLVISLVIYMPSARELGGERLAGFLPDAVVADTAGRISVVARNINNGILQFSRTGEFNRFIGAPSVSRDPWDNFIRMLPWISDEAAQGGIAHVPTEYNMIRIDEHNFIWGTISAIANEDIIEAVDDPTSDTRGIKRLNPLGDDILMRKGERGIWGDAPQPWLRHDNWDVSRIVDVGIGPAGIYTLLDNRNGRMFTFNSEGIMLFAFGNIGTRKGNFSTQGSAVSIGYIGRNIAVLDATLNEVIIFEPTLYGHLIIDAEQHFMDGNYELAYEAWARAAEQNANFSHAFVGLGTARFNDRDFISALNYFRHAGGDTGREGYSRAREMMRRDQMEAMFPIISMVVIFGALALVGFFIFKGIRNYAISDDVFGYDKGDGNDD